MTTTVTEFIEVAETAQQWIVLNRLARADRLALGGVPLTDPAERRAALDLADQGIASVAENGLFYLTLLGRLIAYLLRAGQDTESEGGE